MKRNNLERGAVRRAINDVVMAEMFFVQATVESVAAIGDSLDRLGGALTGGHGHPVDERSVRTVLRHMAVQAIEPYSSRLKYLRQLHQNGQGPTLAPRRLPGGDD